MLLEELARFAQAQRHRRVRSQRARREQPHAGGVRHERLPGAPLDRRRRLLRDVSDRIHRGSRAREPRARALRPRAEPPPVPPTPIGGRGRRLPSTRHDRQRARRESHALWLHRADLSGASRGEGDRGAADVSADLGDPAKSGSCGDRRSRGRRRGGRTRREPRRRARRRGDLFRLRRSLPRRARRAGEAARLGALFRHAHDRAQLSRLAEHGSRGVAECDLRAALAAGGDDRHALAERRPRARHARLRQGALHRALDVRVGGQQGRRLVERPARLLGRGSAHASHRALSRKLRKSPEVCTRGAGDRAREADRSDQGGAFGRRRACRRQPLGGAVEPRRRRRRALRAGGCHPHEHDGGTVRRSRALVLAASPRRPARRDHHQRRRTWHPRCRRLRGARARASFADARDRSPR